MTGVAAKPTGPLAIVTARAFIATVPWRWGKDVPVGDGLADGGVARWGGYRHVHPDPHQYVIRDWREVAGDDFDRFVALIARDGYRATYRAPYRPDHEMRNRYLEIDGWCYWFIAPRMLNRERAAERKHVPVAAG